jgi:ubiquinone/menaquinone biosynthesis C-methylase UbiE
MNMQYENLQSLRLAELELIIDILKNNGYTSGAFLEIGAGAGWQAKRLSEKKYQVEAIDIASSIYSEEFVWPIKIYDGKKIPFDDKIFDIVFTSNVLEHVSDLQMFNTEIARVLKPDGITIHVVPSAAWRFWTALAHYPFLFKLLLAKIKSKFGKTEQNKTNDKSVVKEDPKEKKSACILTKLFPRAHGLKGNVFAELFYFRRKRWEKEFKKQGWKIIGYRPNRLFYTGYVIFGSLLSIKTRKKLAFLLGSSCHIFILKK